MTFWIYGTKQGEKQLEIYKKHVKHAKNTAVMMSSPCDVWLVRNRAPVMCFWAEIINVHLVRPAQNQVFTVRLILDQPLRSRRSAAPRPISMLLQSVAGQTRRAAGSGRFLHGSTWTGRKRTAKHHGNVRTNRYMVFHPVRRALC